MLLSLPGRGRDGRPGWLARVRRPEYTGRNRCVPCTAINLVVAAVLTIVAWSYHPAVGVAVGVSSGGLIALLGYLVPGTPTLTARYLPERVHAWFGAHGPPSTTVAAFDAERVLADAGVIVYDEGVDDLVVAPSFETAWTERMRALADLGRDELYLAALVGVEPDRLALDWQGEAFTAWVDDRWVGQWESRAAFVADVAAAGVFEAGTLEWSTLSLAQQSQVLGVLRLFLERCPTCDGDIALGQEVVRSCCRPVDVIAATCQACAARVFETPYDVARFRLDEAA